MTGDVLPCFDAFSMVLPEDTASIVTVPITLDIASNHGVIVASKSESANDNSRVYLVDNLLQKPSLEELVSHQAILDDGRTLLDTGIIAVKGKAWVDLAMLACSSQPMISGLLHSKKEVIKVSLCFLCFPLCCCTCLKLGFYNLLLALMFQRLQLLSFSEPLSSLLTSILCR